MSKPDADVTGLLSEWCNDNHAVEDQLFGLVYDELRRRARSHLARERPDHTLQPTALVHEAYLRLIDQNRVQWQSRVHFFAIASRMMRRILVDHARRRAAKRRGGANPKVTLDEGFVPGPVVDVDVIALDAALDALAEIDPDQGRLVEMRFYGGLTIEETAEVLGVSVSTVKREWSTARAWLLRELDET